MCGRYVSPEQAAIEREWRVGRSSGGPFKRLFNVAPTVTVPIIRRARDADELELAAARWGLIPGWWKQAKPPGQGHNARSEEAAGKPMWRDAFVRWRCIMPADGWYEWQEVQEPDQHTGEIKTIKQPYYMRRPDGHLAAMAGLFSYWRQGDTGVLSCAVLTKAAAPSVADVHDRMPVILPPRLVEAWLDPAETNAAHVASMIADAETAFAHHPVTRRLNNARTDEEEFVLPVAQA